MALTELFTSIANAIRGKDGTTDPIPALDFAERILAIESGNAESEKHMVFYNPTTPTMEYSVEHLSTTGFAKLTVTIKNFDSTTKTLNSLVLPYVLANDSGSIIGDVVVQLDVDNDESSVYTFGAVYTSTIISYIQEIECSQNGSDYVVSMAFSANSNPLKNSIAVYSSSTQYYVYSECSVVSGEVAGGVNVATSGTQIVVVDSNSQYYSISFLFPGVPDVSKLVAFSYQLYMDGVGMVFFHWDRNENTLCTTVGSIDSTAVNQPTFSSSGGSVGAYVGNINKSNTTLTPGNYSHNDYITGFYVYES